MKTISEALLLDSTDPQEIEKFSNLINAYNAERKLRDEIVEKQLASLVSGSLSLMLLALAIKSYSQIGFHIFNLMIAGVCVLLAYACFGLWRQSGEINFKPYLLSRFNDGKNYDASDLILAFCAIVGPLLVVLCDVLFHDELVHLN